VSAENATLLKTPFYAKHVALGAKMVPFAGFEMPVQYPSGITAEHNTVRTACGMFDVSHMGEFKIIGRQAMEFVNYVTSNNVAALASGQVHYSGILYENGTFVDDCLVYYRSDEHVMMVVNASNKDKDFKHISQYLGKFECELEDISDKIALLALQGPKAQEILLTLTDANLDDIKYYHFIDGHVGGVGPMIISRTGYTGEDGFELYHDVNDAEKLWDAIMATGKVLPVGLGCRDSLRLEMGMALYGNDIDDTVTPLEANLGWLVKFKKGDFVGKAALEKQKAAGVPRKLVGFTIADKAFPRHGYPVFVNGQPSGNVCSGTMSPSLQLPIGTCYVPASHATVGNKIEIDVRGKRLIGTITEFPFWKHGSHR